MSRQFTWWRRFHTTQKLKRSDYWKGYSKLLQEIEFGQWESDPLWEQSYLEEAVYEKKKQAYIEEKSYIRDKSSLEDVIRDFRKAKHKRTEIMRSRHCEAETKRLSELSEKLAEEFNLSQDYVKQYMETFDGTTRQLFYSLRAISQNREIPSNDTIDRYPRAFVEQPRHILKREHIGLKSLWKKVARERKIYGAY